MADTPQAQPTDEQKRIAELEAEVERLNKAEQERKEAEAATIPAPTAQMDKTVSGGRYKQGDGFVNAHGEKVK